MSEQEPEILSCGPLRHPWTPAIFLWSHLTLSSHKSLSHPQLCGQLPDILPVALLHPPHIVPYPPHSGTFVSLGLATVSRWEQELLRGPRSFPGSSRGMQVDVSSGRPVSPARPPASKPCLPRPRPRPRPRVVTRSEQGTPARPWASLCAFRVTVTPPILAESWMCP